MAGAARSPLRLDLTPARWIWLPSARTLPNTFLLFRRELTLDAPVRRCTGWITAESRYRLTVNGERVQWGPAPADPRWPEADPVDLTAYLRPGVNVIGVEVCYYGHGDGAWPGGKPGLLLALEVEDETGAVSRADSDSSWQVVIDRAHRPGAPKRWFLRALQETFDARVHPHGWDTPGFTAEGWLPAVELGGAADASSMSADYPDYFHRDRIAETELRRRDIPMLDEQLVRPARLAATGTVQWHRDPDDWFDFRVPGSLRVVGAGAVCEGAPGEWQVEPGGVDRSTFLTFELAEQIVGWPRLQVRAMAGTIVEVVCQESRDATGDGWLDSHFYSWTRFVCRDGENVFECFDFESVKWLQVHVRSTSSPVVVSNVSVRRRSFPWPHAAQAATSDDAINAVVRASLNTLDNSAQETCVDGMGRERAQYAGDGSHQLHPVRLLRGEYALARRFLRTFSHGLTPDGFFLDCWPSSGRLDQVAYRQWGASSWGPLLDHGVGFVTDCWHHYLQSGDLDAVCEPYPRLLEFVGTVLAMADDDGLLPVVDLGLPQVWIDHEAYVDQRHKQCAYSLYVAAMLTDSLAPLARALGDDGDRWECAGAALLAAVRERFWDAEGGLFVANLPWVAEEGRRRLCDRSLATAVLHDQCPSGDVGAAVTALVDCPPELGISYPANARWRYLALAKAGRVDVVLRDLRERWATMPSVVENNTVQESWTAAAGSTDQWSHCAMGALEALVSGVAGVTPLTPGFATYVVRPQSGGLAWFDVGVHTPHGVIRVQSQQTDDGVVVAVTTPPECVGTLVLPTGVHPLPPGRITRAT